MKADIALQMYTMRDFMKDRGQLEDTLRRVSEIGYKTVQITRPAWIGAEELKAMMDACGIRADSVLAHSMHMEEEYDAVLREAEIYGTDVVRLDGIPKELAQDPGGFRAYARILEEGGRRFRAAGLSMYYHFHAFEWTSFGDAGRGIDLLLNGTSPENVGFQPDVFWLTAAGTEPSDSLKLFAGRVRYVHVKDYAVKPRSGALEDIPNSFAAVGKGNLNWKGIMRTCEELGVRSFVVEQDQCDGDVFGCIRDSYDALKGMLI